MRAYVVLRADANAFSGESVASQGRVLGVFADESPARICRDAEHDFDTPAWIEEWEVGGQMVAVDRRWAPVPTCGKGRPSGGLS